MHLLFLIITPNNYTRRRGGGGGGGGDKPLLYQVSTDRPVGQTYINYRVPTTRKHD